MSTSSSSDVPTCMSREDEATIKTALAVVVLQNKHRQNDDAVPPTLLGNLRNISSKLPSSQTFDGSHLRSMFQIATSTASNVLNNGDDSSKHQARGTLQGICQHLAMQLVGDTTTATQEWIKETISSPSTIAAVSTVWHYILQVQPVIGGRLLQAVGQTLQELYASSDSNNQHSIAVHMVKLVELAEASVSVRLSTTNPTDLLQEFTQALGSELCLPIPTRDLAYFWLKNGNPGNKVMLRFCLYDLMEKLSACSCSGGA